MEKERFMKKMAGMIWEAEDSLLGYIEDGMPSLDSARLLKKKQDMMIAFFFHPEWINQAAVYCDQGDSLSYDELYGRLVRFFDGKPRLTWYTPNA